MPRKPSDLSTAKLTKERALAKLRVLQSGQLEGTLIPRDLAQSVWATAFAALRDRCLGVPDRVVARAGANCAPEELRSILESEMRQVLEAVARGEF
ncbi:MAG: hypothetical protein WBY44_31875 [Bryobacteraceae bacterium]